MRFKQFLPLFSNFDLDIRILRVKIYKKQLFLSGDILLHTGRYPAPRPNIAMPQRVHRELYVVLLTESMVSLYIRCLNVDGNLRDKY